MKIMENFNPVLRFVAVSDVHYKSERTKETERMEKAMKAAYRIAEEHPTYKKLDALVVVGDFANSGEQVQMDLFKETLDNFTKEETKKIMLISSHEFHGTEGMEGGYERFEKTFGQKGDQHNVVNGFHFISVSSNNGAGFKEDKVAFMAEELEKAAADDPKKPIFVFQHPHIQSTVYGSILWGESDFTPVMMNYPQIIDFSGHSHAPINDPRSIHQQHFTSLGTGTMTYFELDEFDTIYGTIPPGDEDAAQMTIVEADAEGRVRIYPYDVLTDNFFPRVWKIDTPYDPDSFLYTEAKRYANAEKVYFTGNEKIEIAAEENECTVTFPQAKCDDEYVNGYEITVRRKSDGLIERHLSVWSGYYFYNMPETVTQKVEKLKSDTEYILEIKAYGFWKNYSEKITKEFKTK